MPASASGDQLLKWLKPAFADGGSVSEELLKKQFAGTLADGTVSAAALNGVAAAGSCEAFPLVRAAESNGDCTVNAYLDEVGCATAAAAGGGCCAPQPGHCPRRLLLLLLLLQAAGRRVFFARRPARRLGGRAPVPRLVTSWWC